MSSRATRLFTLVVLTFLAAAPCAYASARAVIGSSWLTPPGRLQSLIDATYGPGLINVPTDYFGARDGDPEVMVWNSIKATVVQVREISGTAHRPDFGWYLETGGNAPPPIDGHDDGPLLKSGGSTSASLAFGRRPRQIGFYLRTADAGSGLGPRTFYSNRLYNDLGPGGTGALHEPFIGGDIQALVFDVSRWTRPNTWLVCFEDHDSGAIPGPCCDGTDNDYADYVFEVRAESTTDALAPSFGFLKALYRE
jgi:hypothetical protein